MSRRLLRTLLAASAVAAFSLTGASAFAAGTLVDCSSATVLSHIQGGGGTAANGCQYIDPPDNSTVANLANINSAGGTGFFGFSDWTEAVAKQDLPDGAGQSGNWSIPSYDSTATYMIVFKDGSLTNLIGFTLISGISSGTWTSPFTDPPFDLCAPDVTNCSQVKDVSHFTIFKRGGDEPPPDVSEPATLGLLGLGLLGIAIMRRRRSV